MGMGSKQNQRMGDYFCQIGILTHWNVVLSCFSWIAYFFFFIYVVIQLYIIGSRSSNVKRMHSFCFVVHG